MESELLRIHIIEAARDLVKYGLVVLEGGNISARDKDTGLILITPSGLPYDTMRPEDVVAVDLNGKTVEGINKPSVDLNTHLAVYRARSDIFSVAHTHSTFATALSTLGLRLPDVTSTLAYTNGAGGVDIVPYYHVYEPMLGKLIAEKMGSRYAVILQNHGIIASGRSIHHCLQIALMVEQVAQIYLVAKSVGEPIEMDPDRAREIHEHYTNLYGQ